MVMPAAVIPCELRRRQQGNLLEYEKKLSFLIPVCF